MDFPSIWFRTQELHVLYEHLRLVARSIRCVWNAGTGAVCGMPGQALFVECRDKRGVWNAGIGAVCGMPGQLWEVATRAQL